MNHRELEFADYQNAEDQLRSAVSNKGKIMSLKNVFNALQKINDTSSSNDKVKLLSKYLEKKLFLKVVKYTLDSDRQFNVKSFPKFTQDAYSIDKSTDLKQLFDHLDKLASQNGANKQDKNLLFALARIDEETYEVVKRICKKDLKCGASSSLVNKAVPNTVIIPPPYMRCSTDKKIGNINYPAIIQEKADCVYDALLISKTGKIKFLTRAGNEVQQLNHLKNVIRTGDPKAKYGVGEIKQGFMNSGKEHTKFLSKVYTGELVVIKNGKIIDRKTGSGIINQCIQGTALPEDARCVAFRMWDTLPLSVFMKMWKGEYDGDYEQTYRTRLYDCAEFVRAVRSKKVVGKVMSKRVNNYEEAQDFYADIRKAGGEGAVIKNETMHWKNGTSTDQIKMKNVSECELVIVGWEYGKEDSKYEMCMGALKCESSCGKLKVNIGGGFTDKEREEDWDLAEGSIISAEFESVIQDKRDKKTWSLYQGRYKEARPDRSEADTLEEIMER